MPRARPRIHFRPGAALVLAVALAGVGFGTALAADGNDALSDAALLFGHFPETPTAPAAPAGVLDAANPQQAILQQPGEVLPTLPADARGRPDWMRAIRDGAIAPRADVGGTQRMQTLDLDILMKNTAQMPYVRFPHRAHTEWLACSNCHDALFVPRAGANPTSMARVLQGESCGTCHSSVAFAASFTCERCHSVPQSGQQRWW